MAPRDHHPLDPNYAKHEPDLILSFEKWSFDMNKE